MAGVQRVHRVASVAKDEARPVLVPAGNKARPAASAPKPTVKAVSKVERSDAAAIKEKNLPHLSSSFGDPVALQRNEKFPHSNLSLNVSFSSDCSADSIRSRASTGRIRGRPSFSGSRRQGVPSPDKIISKLEKIASDGPGNSPSQELQGKRRCAWVTPNTEACYAAFHDEEWGVPVHDDKRLFELLVLSSALAELTWPVILNKRHAFREVFVDFDPVAVSKLNEKKISAPGSIGKSLLSEPKLRAVIENARQILKIIEEFGSFDRYCWSFVNHKPIVSNFRYPHQVPVKTAKADAISKELVRRGFRGVGPTVVYSFMQVAGITNDHLLTCYRFKECCAPASSIEPGNADRVTMPVQAESINKMEEDSSLSTTDTTATTEQEDLSFDLELATAVSNLSFS